MNALAPRIAFAAIGEASVAACFHCGEALGDSIAAKRATEARVGDAMQRFCCAGCAAAATWIEQAGLDDYYRLRTANPQRAAPDTSDLAAWDSEEVLAAHARNVPGGREIVLATDGMHCAACAWLIDRALSRVPGVCEVSANAVTGRVRLGWDPARSRLSAILARMQALGYRPYLAGGVDVEGARRREQRQWLLRLGIAGIVTLQAMMLAEALYLDTTGEMPTATRDFFRWLTFLVATPVVFYCGYPFLAGAWRELRERRAGMDTLVATSTLLAWSASAWQTLQGGAQVWFDAAVMFVFLLLAARWLEMRARQVAGARIDSLARARPVLARRELASGGCEEVPLTRIAAGDVIRVAAGEHLPADGLLLAAAALDESLLTGESRPVPRAAGETGLAGSICRDREVRLAVTATGAATRLSAIERLVLRAQEHKPRLARQADRVASWFVLGILLCAALVYLHWRSVEPARAFEITLALLVVSCPCALSLAVPAALAAAYSRLSALGVLVLRPDALQQLAAIDTVVFDKTGTLGDGQWRIAAVTCHGVDSATALGLAAALERGNRHPLASAFRAHDSGRAVQDIAQVDGCGIEGCIDYRPLRLGTAPWAAGRDDDGAIWLGDGTRPLACFHLEEQPRPDAAVTLQRLSAQHLDLLLLSGDAREAVHAFAARLPAQFEEVAGRLLPEDKLARVRALQARGRRVAMVGDGINDAPVLAGADVSIAVEGGAALARQNADLVMLHPSLERLADAVQLARRTRKVMRQNIGWALAYNLVALPVVASGHVAPWGAALAMVGSSLTVTINALRLARAAPR
jgi:P-type Cu2+ transporter